MPATVLIVVLATCLASPRGVLAAARLPIVLQPPPEHLTSEPDNTRDNSVSPTTLAPSFRIFYQVGKSEDDLPECSPWSVCSKVDKYDTPWVERQCRCPSSQRACSLLLDASDGHTVTDKTRLFKLCEPTRKLPKCRFFRDITWTLRSSPTNVTEQVMHCHCPKSSVAYLVKRQTYQTQQGVGYQYSFACSPQSRLRCQRKEPCRLFTVRKRPEVDEVNTNSLCQCPHGHHCPRHHRDAGVIPGKSYTEEAIRTYSGYCL